LEIARLRRERNALQRDLVTRTEEVSQLTHELSTDRQTLVSLKDELAGELKAMNQLHELSSRLLDHTEIQPLLEEVLEASMALLNADFGNVQLYDPKSHGLKIVAQRGFEQDFLVYFDNVQEGTASCGAALERRERVIVEDVLTDPGFAPHLPIVNAAGYRAVQSTPLISRGGEMLGMISTHFRQPHRPSVRDLRLVDLYARQATEMIERKHGETALLAAKDEAERRAREAEEAQSILKTIMEYAPEGITLTGGPPDFPIIANSKHAAQMIGRNAETLVNIPSGSHASAYGLLLSDGTLPRPEQLPLYRASRHGEVVKDEEWIIERPDGSRLHAISNVAPIRDSQGRVIGAINCWHDITERKRAEQALRASEERFRRYFDLGLIGMAITSPDKGCLEANDELCRILGYPRGELLQKNWAEMTHPDDLAADVAQFNRVMAGEIDGYTLEKRWIGKDGRTVDSIMAAKCMRRADGSVDYFVGLVQDITERKRAEDNLRRSEIYLAEGQRLSHTASWAWNVSTGEIYWSAELFRIYGLDPDKVKPGYPAVLNYIHPEDRPRVQKTFEDAVQKEREYELAYRVVWSDGTIRHVNNLAHPVFNEAGTLIEYGGTTIDITERREVEEKLRRSEANLAEGQRISHTGSWAWNASSGEIFISQELLRIFALEAAPSTLTHETFLTFIHPEDRSRVRQASDDAVRNSSNYEAEYRIVRADSSIRHLHNLAHPVFNESGVLVEYIGTAMDITERKQAEDLVRKAHERYEIAMESISDNLFGLSSDGRFTYLNKHAAKQMEILGKDPAHLIGKVAWEEFPDLPNKENVQRVLTERVSITDELYYAPLGEWVENHMYPSHDGGLVTFQRCITVRKRTEEELRKTQAELAHVTRLTTMGELAASIAHEINQPLGAIVNNANVGIRLVTADNGSLDELAEVLSDIVSDASRTGAIIARIRALMRQSSPEKTLLQLKDVVTDVLTLAQQNLAEGRIEVRTELPEDLPNVWADRLQLQQVLINLVLNGIDAMSATADEWRVITIRAQRDAWNGQSMVLTTVQDFGSGFRVEDSERLFHAFFTTKPEGMGMGLRISRSIVEAHGGRLWATSNAGQGATFYCTLPAQGK
jgi:PAS domain S-box-containing protein